MAIAAPHPQDQQPPEVEAITQETGTLPGLPEEERERRRSSVTMPRIEPGRYLAIEDGDQVKLLKLEHDVIHIGAAPRRTSSSTMRRCRAGTR